MKPKKRILWILLLPLYCACSTTYLGKSGQLGGSDWRTASREPVGLAPDPASTPEAVVQVYAARTISWRGYFGVHTWIAVKPSNAEHFTIHEVIGYRLRRAGTVVVSRVRAPDARWFGAHPELLHRGGGASLSVRQQLSHLARPELQYLHRIRGA
jgi:hypothetical protein